MIRGRSLRFLLLILFLCLTACTTSRESAPVERLPEPTPAPGPAQVVPSAPSQVPEEVRLVPPVIDADMSADLLYALKESKDCRGIESFGKGEKAHRDFKVHMRFTKADTPEMEEQWLWTIFDTRRKENGVFRAAGTSESVAEAMRDMCMEIRESFNAGAGSTVKP